MSEYVTSLGNVLGSVKSGSRGTAVKALQNKLVALGFNTPPDGVFGKGTRAAVVVVQRLKKLTTDGVAGPKTEIAIDELLSADQLTAASKKKSRIAALKASRERSRQRELGDFTQDEILKKLRAAGPTKLPGGPRPGAVTRTDYWAAKQAAQQAADGGNDSSVILPPLLEIQTKSKMPLILGGVAVLGVLGYAVMMPSKKRK